MTREELIKILSSLGMKPLKSQGQCFLLEESIADKMVEAAEIGENDKVLEVGPGLGTLSRRIIPKGCKYIGVEKDPRFIIWLKRNYEKENAKFIRGDALFMSPKDLFDLKEDEKIILISNTPFSITSQFLLWILKNKEFIKRCVITLQKEVVERLLAKPLSEIYCAMSVIMQVHFDIELLFKIRRLYFYPRPKVTPCVIRMFPKDLKFDYGFYDFMHKVFKHRMKLLKNVIRCEINRRVYELEPYEFVKLYEIMKKKNLKK